MKKVFTISLLIVCLVAGISWINASHPPTPLQFVVPANWPQPKYDFKSNPLTREGFALGRKLFYDVRFSKSNTLSCASCHQQFSAFCTYEHSLSHGVNHTLTNRNAPALQNLAWQTAFRWDGSIDMLDHQPLMCITPSNYMGESLDNIIAKLQKDAGYKKMFAAAFGSSQINSQRITQALSQFMLMLVSSNSKYDRVMRGEDTFILPEKLGYDIFKQKCSACHAEPFFTDFSYRNAGLTLDAKQKDFGRMTITGDKNDSLKFRVPSLRNVILTFPYGHDGRFFNVQNVMEHYRKDMVVSPLTDSLLQHKIALSNYEIGQLTAFLYTLTDSVFLKNRMYVPEGYVTPKYIHNHS